MKNTYVVEIANFCCKAQLCGHKRIGGNSVKPEGHSYKTLVKIERRTGEGSELKNMSCRLVVVERSLGGDLQKKRGGEADRKNDTGELYIYDGLFLQLLLLLC